MNFAHPFFPRSTFLFKGGGGSAAPAVVAPPPAITPPPAVTTVDNPVASTIMAPAAAPATVSGADTIQATVDAKRAAGKRKGINSTILAGAPAPGDSGGTLGGGAGGKNNLLGGG